MIKKIIPLILYILVLYNFSTLEIGNIYNFNFSSRDFILFLLNFFTALFGLITLKFFNIKDIKTKNELIYTFKSIILLYVLLIIFFLISQEYLLNNRDRITETKLSGIFGFLALSLLLLVSPILTFVKNSIARDYLTLFRKLSGILVVIVTIRHTINFIVSHYSNGQGFLDYWNYFWGQMDSPVVWSGTIGLGAMILLGLTSNKISVKIMGARLWKGLHFLVFPIFLLTMLHVWYLGRIDWFYGGFTAVIILARIMATIARRYRRKKAGKVTKYICPPCGFIYDEKFGDPDSGIAPGTRFQDIPNDWYCPICGVKKSDFVPYYETEESNSIGNFLKVVKVKLITSDVLHFILKTDKKINYKPGQYIGITMKDSQGEFTRSYSIVSNNNKSLEFYIKLKADGRAGKKLKNTVVGDEFKVTSVYGEFVLQQNSNPKVFIATGTGLAPIISMIDKNNFSKNNHLFFGVAKKQDLFGLQRIENIKNLEKHIFLSQENIKGFNYGRIDLNNYKFDQNTEFYICGNPNMVENFEKLLKYRGYTNIFSEKFN